MNLLTSLVALRVTRLGISDRNYELLVSWLKPELKFGHNYPITYELSRALHDLYFDGTYLGVTYYNSTIRCTYLNHLTSSEQKELSSWIYDSNIFRTPRY